MGKQIRGGLDCTIAMCHYAPVKFQKYIGIFALLCMLAMLGSCSGGGSDSAAAGSSSGSSSSQANEDALVRDIFGGYDAEYVQVNAKTVCEAFFETLDTVKRRHLNGDRYSIGDLYERALDITQWQYKKYSKTSGLPTDFVLQNSSHDEECAGFEEIFNAIYADEEEKPLEGYAQILRNGVGYVVSSLDYGSSYGPTHHPLEFGLGIQLVAPTHYYYQGQTDYLEILDVRACSPLFVKTPRVQPGQRIVSINGRAVGDDMTYQDAYNKLMAGEEEETLTLLIEPGKRKLTVKTSQQCPAGVLTTRKQRSVLPQGIAYMKLAEITETELSHRVVEEDGEIRFIAKTYAVLDRMASDLAGFENDDNVRGLVLDLRHNFGGPGPTAAKIIDMFIDQGVAFYTLEALRPWENDDWIDDQNKIELADQPGQHFTKPMVILVDEFTASSAEIVAQVLAIDYERAYLFGVGATRGKAIGQKSFYFVTRDERQVSLGWALHLTTLRAISPAGYDWHGRGIVDLDVLFDSDRLDTKRAEKLAKLHAMDEDVLFYERVTGPARFSIRLSDYPEDFSLPYTEEQIDTGFTVPTGQTQKDLDALDEALNERDLNIDNCAPQIADCTLKRAGEIFGEILGLNEVQRTISASPAS